MRGRATGRQLAARQPDAANPVIDHLLAPAINAGTSSAINGSTARTREETPAVRMAHSLYARMQLQAVLTPIPCNGPRIVRIRFVRHKEDAPHADARREHQLALKCPWHP